MILVGHGPISYEPAIMGDYFPSVSERITTVRLERIIHVDELGGNEGEEFQLLIIPEVPKRLVSLIKQLIKNDVKDSEVSTRVFVYETEDFETDKSGTWMILIAMFNEY